uniref:BolA-like protein n=1 Tax=Parascaris univalens TaxID=6257 RepID=A0A915BYH3_PARUN
MVTQQSVEEKLTQQLNPSHLEVKDESDGCGAKFRIVIVSEQFNDKPTIACHRLVQAALKDEMSSIHALTIKTFSPEKWAAQ